MGDAALLALLLLAGAGGLNCTNHLAHTPLDDAFAQHAWTRQE